MSFHPKFLASQHSGSKLKRQLQLYLLLFIVILSIPTAFLIRGGYVQFEKEMYFQYKWHAENLVKQLNSTLEGRLKIEQERPYDDYHFYKNSSTIDLDQGLTLSPLATISDRSTMPGIIGYFQIDQSGLFSCPLLPFSDQERFIQKGIDLSNSEISRRLSLRDIMRSLLNENGFLDESSVLPPKNELQKVIESTAGDLAVIRIDALRVSSAKNGYLIFFRNVWVDNSKIVQGFVVKQRDFLEASIKSILRESHFSSDLLLQLRNQSDVIQTLSYQSFDKQSAVIKVLQQDPGLEENVFHQNALISPLDNFTLIFSTHSVPLGPSAAIGMYLMLVVAVIVIIGLLFIYKLGVRQIHLNEERLSFVSAVSHELKTPLTSIIMYADMLREDIVRDEQKKLKYYDFIFFEGERLGRLISNVLRLSKIGQKQDDLALEYTSVSDVCDLIKSKTSTLIENAEFELNIHSGEGCEDYQLLIDLDVFTQIVINLVDNAIKFSQEQCQNCPERRRIDICFRCDVKTPEFLCFSVRDFGPGIAAAHCPHIFDIFYRAGNELTRKTQGTGIGLSLVSELVQSMGGSIEFSNCDPGVEFRVCLQCRST